MAVLIFTGVGRSTFDRPESCLKFRGRGEFGGGETFEPFKPIQGVGRGWNDGVRVGAHLRFSTLALSKSRINWGWRPGALESTIDLLNTTSVGLQVQVQPRSILFFHHIAPPTQGRSQPADKWILLVRSLLSSDFV